MIELKPLSRKKITDIFTEKLKELRQFIASIPGIIITSSFSVIALNREYS